MKVSVVPSLPTDALDTVALALTEGAAIPGRFGALVGAAEERGEVRRRAGSVAHLHDGDLRVIVVGLGGDAPTPEDLRVAAAHVLARAQSLGTDTLHWIPPHAVDGPAWQGVSA